MVVRLKKNASPKQVKEALEKIKKNDKPFDISRFAGKLTWGQLPLAFQRDLRSDD